MYHRATNQVIRHRIQIIVQNHHRRPLHHLHPTSWTVTKAVQSIHMQRAATMVGVRHHRRQLARLPMPSV